MSDPDAGAAFAPHDHRACISGALASARRVCAERRLKLTPVRERTLQILLESHAALGAYDVLARLAAEGMGAQPPVAYRALDFLVQNGFAHRIEKLNAYVACAHPGAGHDPAFLICRTCRKVAEMVEPSEPSALDRAAEEMGFEIGRRVVEAEGLCPVCREDAAAGDAR
jgi:Fur family zinc uptake transcriptional regulator